MRRPSLKIRITAWFALMMFVIEALVLSFLLAVNGTIVTNDPESRLVRVLEHNADRVSIKTGSFAMTTSTITAAACTRCSTTRTANPPAGHVPGGVFALRSRCRSAGTRCAPSPAASRRFMSMMCTST